MSEFWMGAEWSNHLNFVDGKTQELRKKVRCWLELSPFGSISIDGDVDLKDLKIIMEYVKEIESKYLKIKK